MEVAYRTNDVNKINGVTANDTIKSLSGMGNLLLDLDLSESVRPFLGAGMGLANLKIEDHGSSNDTVFAYQAIAGVGFPVSHVTTLDLQYRYFATADPNFDGAKSEYQSHNFFAGLRFDF